MGLYVKLMSDAYGREEIFVFDHDNDLPIHKLSRQDVTTLKQSLEATEKETVSVRCLSETSKIAREVFIKRYR